MFDICTKYVKVSVNTTLIYTDKEPESLHNACFSLRFVYLQKFNIQVKVFISLIIRILFDILVIQITINIPLDFNLSLQSKNPFSIRALLCYILVQQCHTLLTYLHIYGENVENIKRTIWWAIFLKINLFFS